MKKFWLKLWTMLLALLLALGSLTSCTIVKTAQLNSMTEDERADKLFEFVDTQMTEVTSYTQKMKLTLTATVQRKNLEIEASTKTDYLYTRRDGYLEITESEMETHLDGTRQLTQKTMEGYQDGKMFYGIESKEGDKETKNYLYSEITAEDYQTYKQEKTDLEFDLSWNFAASCKTKSCAKNEDGSWTATYSEFNEEGMKNLGKMFQSLEQLWGDEITLSDVKVTLKTDKKFYPTQMEFTPIFEGNKDTDEEDLPTCTVQVDFSNINGLKDYEKLDLSDYKQVDDLRILDKIEQAVNDFVDLDDATFKLETEQTEKNGYSTKNYTESDIGTIKNTDNGFAYDLSIEAANYTITINYKNGNSQTTVKQKGKQDNSYTTQLTDTQAKKQIKSLFTPSSLDRKSITSITSNNNGVYTITFSDADVDLSNIKKQIISKTLDKSSTITVTFKDGKLVSYVYNITVSAKLDGGIKYSLNYTATCTYTYPKD